MSLVAIKHRPFSGMFLICGIQINFSKLRTSTRRLRQNNKKTNIWLSTVQNVKLLVCFQPTVFIMR